MEVSSNDTNRFIKAKVIATDVKYNGLMWRVLVVKNELKWV